MGVVVVDKSCWTPLSLDLEVKERSEGTDQSVQSLLPGYPGQGAALVRLSKEGGARGLGCDSLPCAPSRREGQCSSKAGVISGSGSS